MIRLLQIDIFRFWKKKTQLRWRYGDVTSFATNRNVKPLFILPLASALWLVPNCITSAAVCNATWATRRSASGAHVKDATTACVDVNGLWWWPIRDLLITYHGTSSSFCCGCSKGTYPWLHCEQLCCDLCLSVFVAFWWHYKEFWCVYVFFYHKKKARYSVPMQHGWITFCF